MKIRMRTMATIKLILRPINRTTIRMIMLMIVRTTDDD